MSKKQGHHAGHSHKHTSVHKHSGTGKHHPAHHRQQHHHKQQKLVGGPLIVHKHPHHPKARGLALGEGVACCSAEALAASLRLAGWPVGDADVLALHEAAGGSRDVGVPILAALEAAAVHGLAGIRPRGFESAEMEEAAGGVAGPRSKRITLPLSATPGAPRQQSMLILGLELPGPHAVTVDGAGVWSWGEWHPWSCFPGAVAEEAWAVRWPAWL